MHYCVLNYSDILENKSSLLSSRIKLPCNGQVAGVSYIYMTTVHYKIVKPTSVFSQKFLHRGQTGPCNPFLGAICFTKEVINQLLYQKEEMH